MGLPKLRVLPSLQKRSYKDSSEVFGKDILILCWNYSGPKNELCLGLR